MKGDDRLARGCEMRECSILGRFILTDSRQPTADSRQLTADS